MNGVVAITESPLHKKYNFAVTGLSTVALATSSLPVYHMHEILFLKSAQADENCLLSYVGKYYSHAGHRVKACPTSAAMQMKLTWRRNFLFLHQRSKSPGQDTRQQVSVHLWRVRKIVKFEASNNNTSN